MSEDDATTARKFYAFLASSLDVGKTPNMAANPTILKIWSKYWPEFSEMEKNRQILFSRIRAYGVNEGVTGQVTPSLIPSVEAPTNVTTPKVKGPPKANTAKGKEDAISNSSPAVTTPVPASGITTGQAPDPNSKRSAKKRKAAAEADRAKDPTEKP